ncbi:MAG: IPT/TIG domain-containing protein [Deltaproteobacteria bacterium]|nr:IPT/TIG domain-containing protein [Deltaproteobacteria bacterium]MBI4224291.1 IPT/TIG domain-containing protein [Deltaproteobacteria bacterium]
MIIFLLGCGSSATETAGFDPSVSIQASPFINRSAPTSGRSGDTITLFGFGFSNEAPNNIVTAGGAAATAASYSLVASPTSSEIESLTFTIPTGAATGAGNLFVTVFENTSNAVSFTVNP